MTECTGGVDFLTLIAGRTIKEKLLKLLLCSGCHLIDVVYAKGSVKSGYFKDMLGLVPEEKKVMITCLVARGLSGRLMDVLANEYQFNKPNTGIAFVIPADQLSV